MVEMVRTAQQEFDQDQLAEAEARLRQGEFTLEDFRTQLTQLAKPGLMRKMMGLLPGMGELNKMLGEVDAEKDMKRLFGIIDSMTPAERRNPQTIDASRRRRIADGSGTQHSEVNDLIKQFDGMASMMKTMSGKGMQDRMKMVQELQQGGLFDPGGRISKQKGSTGKRLSAKEKQQQRKLREKELRRRKREKKSR
jgi:signal recognition particle subunit SRP54